MGYLITVSGAVPAQQAGRILPHEHVLVDFSGQDVPGTTRFDMEEAIEVIQPHLQRARECGITTLIECTPAYLGRNVHLLQRLSKTSGLHILTNTGYYGAANDRFLPRCIHDLSVERLAEKWTGEWRNGIEGTGVHPGFIKIGVDPGTLSEQDAMLVRAAAQTQRATGLTVASHTTDTTSLFEQLRLLEQEQVPLTRFVWVHAHVVDDSRFHQEAAERGIWVEFDGLSVETIEQHVRYVERMRKSGLLRHVLVSHDAGWYSVGEPRGGDFRGYDVLSGRFLPALREAGFGEDEIRMLVEVNPARAFAVESLPPRMQPTPDHAPLDKDAHNIPIR